jgi:hypothetical protein
MLKRCIQCKIEKSVDKFSKRKTSIDGFENQCRACRTANAKANRYKNLEKYQAYEKQKSALPKNLEAGRIRYKKYTQTFPERSAAHAAVTKALRQKVLVRQPCHICGESKTEGHHADYGRPLDVVWLCRIHHMQAHAIVANDKFIRKEA